MTTSSANRVSPDEQVTPDCVIQDSSTTGIVAETKLSLPKDESQWDSNFIQLEKYDDDLRGWWTSTERIEKHDVIALVPLPRAVAFADLLEEGVAQSTWLFGRNVAVVGFFKQSGVKDFLTLKKERGSLLNQSLDSRLRRSVPIDFAHLLVEYNDRKFIDSEPPLPYLLQIIWDNLFVQYAAAAPPTSEKHIALDVSVETVTTDLQENYGFKSSGARSPEIPRQSTIRKALDALVEFRLAEVTSQSNYRVRYKRGRIDTLEKFGRLCFKRQLKAGKKSVRDDRTPSLPGM